MPNTAFLADPIAKEHDPGHGHPEQPARWDAAVRGLGDLRLTGVPPRAATDDELETCHTGDYIRIARNDVARGAHSLSTGDTDIGPRSFDAALHAAGTCLNAVDLVMQGCARNAFCIVRPPGHHASADRGMGFCLFNNIAIAARYAQRRYGVERVAIADWDVHHGNGTQDIFYRDPSVFFFSTHQSPWYPGTGAASETGDGPGQGTTLNCPFPAGSGREEVLGAFRDKLAPRMDDFRPDLVLISAGFDSRIGDPLGHFTLTDADFADLTQLVLEIASTHAGGRLISVLEGGYNLSGLSKAVFAHAHSLALDRGLQPQRRRSPYMNWDRIEGNWKQMTGQVREKWGKLTDSDLEVVAGKKEKLIGRIQERYGIARDEAERQTNEWLKGLKEKVSTARNM